MSCRFQGLVRRSTTTLLVVGLLAAACSSTPPTPAAPPVQSGADAVIADGVRQALNADPIYFFRHVDVGVSNGVADLSGYVWTTDAIYRARQIARGVPGVKRVVTSRLELEREGKANGVTR